MPDIHRPAVVVIATFGNNPLLPKKVADNLLSLESDFDSFDSRFVFIGDSPDNDQLGLALQEAVTRLSSMFTAELLNTTSLGYIGSANRGLRIAAETDAHALLLDPNAVITRGAVPEMYRVLESDPMIGFVNPRSNNAGEFSLPVLEIRSAPVSFEQALADFQFCSPFLPEYQFMPTGEVFCLLIRNVIIHEFGLLEGAYAQGYHKEDDYIFRANRCGFRVAAANKAFVYCERTSSATQDDKEQNATNCALLNSRYPEFLTATYRHTNSWPYQFERIISCITPRADQRRVLRIAFDCTHMVPDMNGTFRATTAIVRSMSKWVPSAEYTVLAREDAANYHGLSRMEGITVVPPEHQAGYDVLLRVGQPFSIEEYRRNATRTTHLFYMMNDTIAWDCHYLYLRWSELDVLWRVTAEYTDGLLFPSNFSQRLFNARFPKARCRPQLVCGLSLSPDDYAIRPTAESEVISNGQNKQAIELLILGNHYDHKFLRPTLDTLCRAFPHHRFLALGLTAHPGPNVRVLSSGRLSDEELHSLYLSSDAIVFPSLYEGFGFPIIESLARDKIVFARDSALNRELQDLWRGPGTLVLYSNSADLVQKLRKFEDIRRRTPTSSQRGGSKSEIHNEQSYRTISLRIFEFVEQVCRQDPRGALCRDRLEMLERMQSCPPSPAEPCPRCGGRYSGLLPPKTFMQPIGQPTLASIVAEVERRPRMKAMLLLLARAVQRFRRGVLMR